MLLYLGVNLGDLRLQLFLLVCILATFDLLFKLRTLGWKLLLKYERVPLPERALLRLSLKLAKPWVLALWPGHLQAVKYLNAQ